MEADWEFEVGGDAPVIEAAWAGFIDLRQAPERSDLLPESLQLAGLAEALIKLNSTASPVWTSKCDVWPRLEADEFDPDEMDAPPGLCGYAMGCYIDVLPGGGEQWTSPELTAKDCRWICGSLRELPLACCRADLMIRRALISPDPMINEAWGFGITTYLTSCGPSAGEAGQTLRRTLAAVADAFVCARN